MVMKLEKALQACTIKQQFIQMFLFAYKKKDDRIIPFIHGSPRTFYPLQLFPCKDMDTTPITSQLKVQSVPWLHFSPATTAFHAAAELKPHMLLSMKHKTSVMLALFLCCSKTEWTRL